MKPLMDTDQAIWIEWDELDGHWTDPVWTNHVCMRMYKAMLHVAAFREGAVIFGVDFALVDNLPEPTRLHFFDPLEASYLRERKEDGTLMERALEITKSLWDLYQDAPPRDFLSLHVAFAGPPAEQSPRFLARKRKIR